MAVVPFGGGTSVVGGLEPLRGAFDALVSLDLGRLEGIESLDERSHLAWLRGGMRLPEADHALAQRGFTLGHTPQSYEWATVGGCVATRSAGQSSTGHGRIEENVVALRCATPAGELATLAVPATAAGPALKQLVIGLRGRAGRDHERRAARVPAARRSAATRAGRWGASRPAGTRCAGSRRPRSRPTSPGSPTRRRPRCRSRWPATAPRRARWARVLRGRCVLVCGWEGDATSVAIRRKTAARALREAGAWPLGEGPGEAWAATRYAGPHLRDDLLDRGVLVETLETADDVVEPRRAAPRR